MDFVPAVKSCLRQYATFAGRAPRSEFWFFFLFGCVIEILAGALRSDTLYTLVDLALLLPTLAVTVRRLHDINRSGWWLPVLVFPVIGWIFWILWGCTAGNRYRNRFGPDPLPYPATQF